MLFQYCHGLATQLAHRMHRPMAQPLHDIGFAALPVRHLSHHGTMLYQFYALHIIAVCCS